MTGVALPPRPAALIIHERQVQAEIARRLRAAESTDALVAETGYGARVMADRGDPLLGRGGLRAGGERPRFDVAARGGGPLRRR